MNENFDFKYLKSRISILQVLTAYRLDKQLRRHNDYLYGPCPIHQGDNPTAFRVNIDRGLWHCHTACGGGDIVELVRRIENCSYAQVARSLQRLLNSTSVPIPLPAHTPIKEPFKPFVAYIRLNPNVSFLQKQKRITVRTALRHEAGTTEKSRFLKNMVAVRLHDFSGNPMGYCGRRLDSEEMKRWGKWRFPKDFPKSNMLFNAHRALPYRNKGVILVECPWAVMRFVQAGINNAVALLGTTVSTDQIRWIVQAPKVLLMFDGDPAGRKATTRIAEKLYHHTKITIHHLSSEMEPEDLTDDQLRSIATHYLSL